MSNKRVTLKGIFLAVLAAGVAVWLLYAFGLPMFLGWQASRIEKADVKSDVQAAIQKSEYRFWVLGGVAPYAPFADTSLWDPMKQAVLLDKYGTRRFRWTSDVMSSGAQLRYKQAAAEYAAKYNSRLAKALEPEMMPAQE